MRAVGKAPGSLRKQLGLFQATRDDDPIAAQIFCKTLITTGLWRCWAHGGHSSRKRHSTDLARDEPRIDHLARSSAVWAQASLPLRRTLPPPTRDRGSGI